MICVSICNEIGMKTQVVGDYLTVSNTRVFLLVFPPKHFSTLKVFFKQKGETDIEDWAIVQNVKHLGIIRISKFEVIAYDLI